VFTGVREGELRGFRWERYTGELIDVAESVWRSRAGEPKTVASKNVIPVIAPLQERLDLLRALQGNPASGYMFPNAKGKPLDLDSLAERVIKPALEKQGLKWLGWHAFRRGLATKLKRLGEPTSTIQRILRHSSPSTTERCYNKTVPEDAAEAMGRFEKSATEMTNKTRVLLA
jgi:integrase